MNKINHPQIGSNREILNLAERSQNGKKPKQNDKKIATFKFFSLLYQKLIQLGEGKHKHQKSKFLVARLIRKNDMNGD